MPRKAAKTPEERAALQAQAKSARDKSAKARAAKKAPVGFEKLTVAEQRFIELVELHGMAASHAMLKSGLYRGTSMDGAAVSATRKLKEPRIQLAIAELREKSAKAIGVTAERVLAETARIAFFDPRRLASELGTMEIESAGSGEDDKGGTLNVPDIRNLSIESAAAVKSWEINPIVGTVKLQFCDKNVALERLFKHLGLYERDNKQKSEGVAELMAAISAANPALKVVPDEPGRH